MEINIHVMINHFKSGVENTDCVAPQGTGDLTRVEMGVASK